MFAKFCMVQILMYFLCRCLWVLHCLCMLKVFRQDCHLTREDFDTVWQVYKEVLQAIMNSKDVKWHWSTISISLIISCERLFIKIGLQLRGLLNQRKKIKTYLQLRGGYGMLLLWWWGSAIPEWQANNRKVGFHEDRPFQRRTYYLS